ncbi:MULTISPECIES: antibiotic biosynthesis monooxygenase [unclassified Embleya]|uniref:antibiotic biosynthesis monooxygenase family protein n=1 Tax=unclassified Embleya TaxID=2699296 RepID=UPI0033FCF3CC
MILVVFRSRFSAQVDEEYGTTEDHLAKKVREMAGEDLLHIKNYVADDGERVALVWWRNPETLEKWREDPEHLDAQRLGREKWYDFYELSVAEVLRTSSNAQPEVYPAP